MRKRRGAEEVARLLKDADRDLAKGLTVADVCRKIGVAQTTYYRWWQTHDPRPGRHRPALPSTRSRDRAA